MRIERKGRAGAIPLGDFRQAVDHLMETVDRSVRADWSGYGPEVIDSDDIRWIDTQLQTQAGDVLEPPWPLRDRVDGQTRCRWDGYSSELSRTIHTSVLRNALIGYQDLVRHNFPSFGQTLSLYGMFPVAVGGMILMDEGNADNPQGELRYEISSTSAGDGHGEPRVDLDVGTVREGRSNAGLAHRKGTTPVLRDSIPPLTGLPRPATNLAYEWLAADLQAIGSLETSVTYHN